MANFNKVVFSSKSVHWDTPLPIFKELHKEFDFNQDPTNRFNLLDSFLVMSASVDISIVCS